MNWSNVLIDGIRAALGVPAASYALAAIGVNLQFGYTGLLNFGMVGFMLAGAYGTAIAAVNGVPLLLAFGCGIAAAVALAVLLGIPTLRLRADFLAVVTISVAEILRYIMRARQFEDVTGGSRGFQGFANPFFEWNPVPDGSYGIGALTFDERQVWVLGIGWLLVAVCAVIVRHLVHSPWGRVLKAVRADDDAPRSLGKNVFAYKMQSLIIGGVIGSLAGILIAVDQQSTTPDIWISNLTFYAYASLIAGGVASTLGPIVGSMIFLFLAQSIDTFLRQAIEAGWFGTVLETTDTGPIRFALVGAALALLIVFRPQGVFGDPADVAAIDR